MVSILRSKANTAIFFTDSRTTKILSVNSTAINRYGYSQSAFQQKKFTDLYPEEVKKRLKVANIDSNSSSMAKHQDANGNIFKVDLVFDSLKIDDRDVTVVEAKPRKYETAENIEDQIKSH